MALDKKISYIFLDYPADTLPHWQGYDEDFDSALITVADKTALEIDKRTGDLTESKGLIKFIIITDL